MASRESIRTGTALDGGGMSILHSPSDGTGMPGTPRDSRAATLRATARGDACKHGAGWLAFEVRDEEPRRCPIPEIRPHWSRRM